MARPKKVVVPVGVDVAPAKPTKPNKFVKLVMTEESYSDDYSTTIMREGISNWEEITHEEYEFLRNNLYRLSGMNGVHLLVQDDVPVRRRIDNIKQIIAEQQKKVEQERIEREKKAAEKALRKRAKTEEQERKLYEELQKKFKK